MNSNAKIPQFKVSIWETAFVFLGAIALVGTGLAVIGIKFYANASTRQQADAVASKIMQYEIPNAQAILGMNIAGAKVALIANGTDQPDVQLLVTRIPVQEEPGKRRLIERVIDGIALENERSLKGAKTQFIAKKLCGETVPVEVKRGRLKRSSGNRSRFDTTPNAIPNSTPNVTISPSPMSISDKTPSSTLKVPSAADAIDPMAKPFVTYRSTVTIGKSRFVVNLLTTGNEAEKKADAVFNSLQCQQ